MRKLFTHIIISSLLMLPVFLDSIQAQSQKTFVKSLVLESRSVIADLDGEVVFEEWDKDFVRVTATVQLTNFDEEMLKRLAIAGRYDLESSLEEGAMYIRMPKLAKQIDIRGQMLEDKVYYKIAVPEGSLVDKKQESKEDADGM